MPKGLTGTTTTWATPPSTSVTRRLLRTYVHTYAHKRLRNRISLRAATPLMPYARICIRIALRKCLAEGPLPLLQLLLAVAHRRPRVRVPELPLQVRHLDAALERAGATGVAQPVQ